MALVIGLVLAAALVGALGLVLLRKATQAEPARAGFSLSLLWLLIRHRPVWAAGIGTIVASFALQITAIANGPVSLVQLVVVMELPFTLLLSALLLGGRLRLRECSALLLMTVGVVTLLVSLAPEGADPRAVTPVAWLLGLVVTVGVIVAALVGARSTARPGVATALAGVAAGVSAGLGAVLVKPVTAVLGDGLGAVLTTWQTWALVVVGSAGFFLLQNAMQAGRLVASQPGVTLANPLVATVWGIGLLHEHVRGGWWLGGAALGGVLLVAGAILLSGSPLLEGDQEALGDGSPPR